MGNPAEKKIFQNPKFYPFGGKKEKKKNPFFFFFFLSWAYGFEEISFTS